MCVSVLLIKIEGLSSDWPALNNWSRDEYLKEAFGEQPVHARGIDLPLSEFLNYSRSTKEEV